MAQIARNLGPGGMGGYGSVTDASESASDRGETPVASNRHAPLGQMVRAAR